LLEVKERRKIRIMAAELPQSGQRIQKHNEDVIA
jgi:hypothetical protein